MSQNRSKLIALFVGNLSNAILHKILEAAIDTPEISGKYLKEVESSWEIAKRCRERINPTGKALPGKDAADIRKKLINNIRAELLLRISRGYTNINLSLVEKLVDESLNEMGVGK